MSTEARSRPPLDSFLDALRAETLAGSENLASWLKHVSKADGAGRLLSLETWLRGLGAFFNLQHLPLSEPDRSNPTRRSFAGELRVAGRALEIARRLLAEVIALGQPDLVEFETFLDVQLRKDTSLDYDVGKILEQPTPLDSLLRLEVALGDLGGLAAARPGEGQWYEAYLGLGRTFERELRACRYVDMLLEQRFKPELDRVENPAVVEVLRGIREPAIRQSLALALLHLHRLLRYLDQVAADLREDRPLRHHLVIFALVDREVAVLCQFLKARFMRGREAGHGLWTGAELAVYSLRTEAARARERELVGVAEAEDAPTIYTRIENSHGLFRNCLQHSVVTLVQAVDKTFDAGLAFPALAERIDEAERLRQDLWGLRQFCKDILEKKTELELDGIVERLARFRESSLRYLMYRDWGDFERFEDAIVTARSALELRTELRKFVSFLEALVAEVSKRSVLQARKEP